MWNDEKNVIYTQLNNKQKDISLNSLWTLNRASENPNIHVTTAQNETFPEPIANILRSRNISTSEEIQSLLSPSLSQLHSSFAMSDMERAIGRVEQAISRGQRIRIYGDYDVDGTVTTAMLTMFLRRIGAQVDYYIPERFTEFYGLSVDTVESCYNDGVSLLITVDTGVTALESIQTARDLDIDVIVCDHHEPSDSLPNAFGILNPIKGNCPYPFKYLCACGVTFKMIQALAERRGQPEIAFEYLDLVAIASTADMVPLTGENRILVHFGLEQMNAKPRPGLHGLMECTNIKPGTITSSTIVYNLAPLINAAGRMGDAIRAVELMLADDNLQAFRLAQDLESKNYRRRVIDDQTFTEAQKVAEDLIADGRRSLVLHNPHWHVGVINIVASRLVEKYHLPTIMLTSIDHIAKGSARSIKNFDVHAALKKSQRLLRQFGGHKYAAGLSLEESNIPALRDEFDAIARAALSEEMLVPEIVIDTELNFAEMSPDFLRLLRQFSPFGYGNTKPCFLTQNVVLAGRASIVGKNHLRFRARQDNQIFEAIGFNLGDKLDVCNLGEALSIVYTIEETLHHNRISLQLYVKDLALVSEQPLRIQFAADLPFTEASQEMEKLLHSMTNGSNASNGEPSMKKSTQTA
ncbi:MAG: single-stranded-DNA-specific exonuclease RecJ [Candidatus Kapaibacterium sp.]|nr:MAG: single-stranded-DNA-specific exonuclease RecJ [Candidatus Kapabacteria bacterium]